MNKKTRYNPLPPSLVDPRVAPFPDRKEFWSLVISDSKIDEISILSAKKIFEKCETSEEFLTKLNNDMADKRNEIEILTRGQSDNPFWIEFRKMTITGSRAHTVNIAARHMLLNSRVKELLIGENEKEMNFPPVVWGRDHEPIARRAFIEKKSAEVNNFAFESRGLLIDRVFPFIGASVDGLYTFDSKIPGCDPHVHLLEIKCPWSIRHDGVLKGASRLKYLKKGDNNSDFVLKKSVPYYTQIQLYLGVYNLDVCSLFIWTPIDSLEIKVVRNDEFINDLFPNLAKLYTDLFVPSLFCK